MSTKEEMFAYAKQLQEMGACNVLISLGGDGALLLTEHGEQMQLDAPKGELQNAVGAGDSMVAGFLAGYMEHASYEEAFQMAVAAGSASAFSEHLATRAEIEQYNPNQYFNRDFLEHCSILPNYDRSSGSDYISGTYRGVPITYCDLHLEVEQESTDSDGNTTTSYYTVFRGPVINLALRQPLNGYVRIRERKNPRKEKGFFSGIINGTADLFNIDRNTVETENAQFNQQFKVDTSDPQLAFYILTPQFMEHIVQADMIVNGYTNIEFNQGIVTLALNNGTDAFELGKYKKNDHFLDEARQRFRYELNSILGIVDEMLTKENLF